MEKILFDKPILSSWSARAAFGLAAAGIVAGVWWGMRDRHEPVRILTAEEQERLRHDPARNPATKSWEASFIREQVPGEERTPEGNAWTVAASGPQYDPADELSPRDKIEEKLCNVHQLKRYREARAAWTQYQNRPATAREQYDSLYKLTILPDGALESITGLERAEFIKMYVDATDRAYHALIVQTPPTDPISAYHYYNTLASYTSILLDFRDQSEFNSKDSIALQTRRDEILPTAKSYAVARLIDLYNQGLKSDPLSLKELRELYYTFHVYHSAEDFSEKLGLSSEDKKTMDAFVVELKTLEAKDRKKIYAEFTRFQKMRGPEICP